MSSRFARKMTPTFIGRKKLYKGYRWYDFQSWLGRTTDSAKSGVVRKTAAYDAVWKTPPLPAPLRPTLRDPLSRKSRIPPRIVFPEDVIAARIASDPEIEQLFEGRLHPYGERPGVDDNSRALPFFEPQSAQVESALRHGPQLMEKLTRKFVSHHVRLVGQGFGDDEAYDMVKGELVAQYKAFEARHAGVLVAAEKAQLISAREAYTTFQLKEEDAIFEAAQRRDLNRAKKKMEEERTTMNKALAMQAARAQAEADAEAEAEAQRLADEAEAKAAAAGGGRKKGGGGGGKGGGRKRRG